MPDDVSQFQVVTVADEIVTLSTLTRAQASCAPDLFTKEASEAENEGTRGNVWPKFTVRLT